MDGWVVGREAEAGLARWGWMVGGLMLGWLGDQD